MPRIVQLARTLGRVLGPQAQPELRWLMQHPTSLANNLRKRLQGWPLQYLLGSQPFGSIDILTRPPTLIPRPETEYWTLKLAETLRGHTSRNKPLRVLDLCTGTACIPLLLCDTLPPRTVSAWAIDISPSAIQLARDNIVRCGYADSPGRNIVRVGCQDIFSQNFVQSLKGSDSLWEPYDVLTSNPPYIPREQYDKLSHTVRDFEDPLALLGEYPPTGELTPLTQDNATSHTEHNNQGLAFYARIASLVQSYNLIRAGGWIALEVGKGQARVVQQMFLPFVNHTDIWLDPWGVERVVFCTM